MRTRRDIVTVAIVSALALAAFLALYRWPPWHHPGRVSAYDLRSGRLLFDVAAPTASVQIHASSAGALVLSGADDCSADQQGSLFAVDPRAGARLWSQRFRAACSSFGGAGETTRDVLVDPVAGGIRALDVRTGEVLWRLALSSAAPLQTADGIGITIGAGGRIRVVSPADGATLGEVRVGSRSYGLGVAGDLAIYETPPSAPGGTAIMRAVDLRARTLRWKAVFPIAGGESRWFAADGAIVVADGGTTIAFDVRTGRRRWHVAFDATELVAAGAGVAVFEHAGRVIARDLASGRARWSRAWPATDGEPVAAADGSVALTGRYRLVVLDARTGATRWQRPLPLWHTRSYGPPLIRDGRVYVPTWSSSYAPYRE